MKRAQLLFLFVAVVWVALASNVGVAQKAPAARASQTAPAAPKAASSTTPKTATAHPVPVASHAAAPVDYNAVVKRYCVTCHNDTNKAPHGDLSLMTFDVAAAPQHT